MAALRPAPQPAALPAAPATAPPGPCQGCPRLARLSGSDGSAARTEPALLCVQGAASVLAWHCCLRSGRRRGRRARRQGRGQLCGQRGVTTEREAVGTREEGAEEAAPQKVRDWDDVDQERLVWKADTTDWLSQLPDHEQLEKVEDGYKWYLVKMGKTTEWIREDQCSKYRYTDRGYESRGEDGQWVNHAQMPQDVSHLSDAQIERLVQELRGDVKVSSKDGDPGDSENFVPLAHIPPLEKWPFHGAELTDGAELLAIAEEELLGGLKELQMTEDLGRAFFLAARWKGENEARRHLGYSVNDRIEDVANMNGSVLALRCLVEQLKRLRKFRMAKPGESEPSDAERLRALQVTGILGTEKGSAVAMWSYTEASRLAKVDICIGDDCMDKGPEGEEVCLRLVAQKAKALGAERLWARTRRTESGRVYAPYYFERLGFSAVPLEEQEEEEWEVFKIKGKGEDIVENVPSLRIWMSTRDLDHHFEKANEWCSEMGALEIGEVADNKEDLADYLGDVLTAEERERLLRY